MGKKSKLTRWLTGSDSGPDFKSKDEVKKENETLAEEYNGINQDYKKLKGVIDQLEREYEESKDYDFVRRYGILKGMIKRTVVHLKLSNQAEQDGKSGLVTSCKEYARQKEEMRKREEKYYDMSSSELSKENEDLQEQIKECKRKISMMEDLIEHLERDYEASKRFIPVQRYRLMKNMVKTLTHNKYI
ncbi:uncharacterized protein LOC135492828 isoform X2 [Lineus longissimus]|uniref:uncharacterized protein LOC135492828 isoform X2 n=1 Tax=Lineus longissimus TaxID=88925 RepID=UPI002B4D1016